MTRHNLQALLFFVVVVGFVVVVVVCLLLLFLLLSLRHVCLRLGQVPDVVSGAVPDCDLGPGR